MRKHNGMRPQDVAILLKIIALQDQPWQLQDLSNALRISLSEVSESLNRSRIAGLVDHQKKLVSRQNLLEFLEHGLRYVFPADPGALVRGVPAAHSHPEFRSKFVSDMEYVWPHIKGKTLGLTIEPLYLKLPESVGEDPVFYKLVCLTDMVRAGKVREVQFAISKLRKMILHESSYQPG
jgi:hypothetical protein